MFIDTHTHLFVHQFDADRTAVVERALDAQVDAMILPNIDLDTIGPMFDLHAQFPNQCLPTIGLHPCSVDERYEEILEQMQPYLSHEAVCAIGETGIDLYWDKTTKALQEASLLIQVKWAKTYKLPIILHARAAIDESIDLIASAWSEDLTGVFHCFDGNAQQLERIMELKQFYIGLGGVATYKKAKLLKELPNLDLNRVVLETDAPYLAPQQYRGKRNESAYINEVAQCLATHLQMEIQDIAEQTSLNAKKLFRLNV